MDFKAIRRSPVVLFLYATVFFVSGIVGSIAHAALLPLWPISNDLYRRLSILVARIWWSTFVALVEFWSGIEWKVYSPEEDEKYYGKESALVIVNHRSDVDWLLGLAFADRYGMLAAAKCYVKALLRYVPIIGFSFWSTEQFFVRRDWDKDSKTLERQLSDLSRTSFPIWVVIFAEGTRYTEEKYQKSVEYSQKNGLPVLKYHMQPRIKGFATAYSNMKKKYDAVYDAVFIFPDTLPSLMHLALCKPCEVILFIRRIPICEVGGDDEESCTKFLRNMYASKDQLMDEYLTKGTVRWPPTRAKPNRFTLWCLCMWWALVIFGIVYYLLPAIWSGSRIVLIITGGFSVIILVGTAIFLYLTLSNKGSSYGLRKANKKKE